MNKLTSQQIRETWLNFFKERGHMIEPGASLIPNNDPTLLWINAGVSALKKYFDGSEIPECKRITNVQKCIRTNDIDNVGRTARHHTFFEMLGNFSIGDYFRKEVIAWAYEILTSDKYFGIDKDKLYVTYHPSDLEAYELWQKAGIDKTHLIPLEGNFWQIGEGPCGPNTEVFFDRGEKWDKDHLGIKLLEQDIENDRYIEIWGIVFSQFNAVNGVERSKYKELPHKNIDTGAGLERIACVLQETDTNFETDLFMPIIKDTEKKANKPYEGEYLMSYRVIADHIRTCTFALADGATFSNEGRGYVLRRILRRAMRYGQKIGFAEPFLYKLVDSVIKVMKDFYPYLIEKREIIQKLIKIEEVKFLKTLVSGENILNSLIENTDTLSGKDAFKLYDTFGFPIELTKEICFDRAVKVDLDEFNQCLEHQKELARNSRKVIESFNKQSKDLLDFTTESEFYYDKEEVEGKVIALFKDGVKVDEIEDNGEIIFDKTVFYGEMGGEVGDTGEIVNDNANAQVTNTTKAPNKQNLHHVKVIYGSIKVGDTFKLKVDRIKRHDIMKNHSATHLLQSALISVLGEEVKQKGSFVNEDYLRFDFSHYEKVSNNDLKRVERKVNDYIESCIDRNTLVLPIEEAKKTGAIAEFGEKYGDTVRVVKFGDISTEFCGGCHVLNTSEIGLFVIESEEAISSGVRRIQALTGRKALEYLKKKELLLNDIKEKLNVSSELDIESKLNVLMEELTYKDSIIADFNQKACQSQCKLLNTEFQNVGDICTLIKYIPEFKKDGMMAIYDLLKANKDNFIIILAGKNEDKNPLLVGVSRSLTQKGIKAGDIVKKLTQLVGGSGGGKPELAQGNITDVEKFVSLKVESLL